MVLYYDPLFFLGLTEKRFENPGRNGIVHQRAVLLTEGTHPDSLEQVKPVYDKKIAEELADCDAAELQAMLEIIHTTKTVIRKNRKVTYAP